MPYHGESGTTCLGVHPHPKHDGRQIPHTCILNWIFNCVLAVRDLYLHAAWRDVLNACGSHLIAQVLYDNEHPMW